MKLTRRKFLISGLLAGTVLVTTSYMSWKSKRRYESRFAADLLPEGTGPDLTAEELDMLEMAVRGLIGDPMEPDHYRDFFSWRAANVPDYGLTYRWFITFLEDEARKRFGVSFGNCSKQDRADLVRDVRYAARLDVPGRFAYAFSQAFRTRLYVFEKRVFKEVLRLFSSTDAWIRLGYESWPGKPQGLVRYRQKIL